MQSIRATRQSAPYEHHPFNRCEILADNREPQPVLGASEKKDLPLLEWLLELIQGKRIAETNL